MKNRLRNKKLKSLASRCLTSDDTLSDARDLLAFYKADFDGFLHRFSIDCLGFSEENPMASKKPPQRKPGERPEKNVRNQKQELQKSRSEEDQDIPMEPSPERLSWEKKLYRQIYNTCIIMVHVYMRSPGGVRLRGRYGMARNTANLKLLPPRGIKEERNRVQKGGGRFNERTSRGRSQE